MSLLKGMVSLQTMPRERTRFSIILLFLLVFFIGCNLSKPGSPETVSTPSAEESPDKGFAVFFQTPIFRASRLTDAGRAEVLRFLESKGFDITSKENLMLDGVFTLPDEAFTRAIVCLYKEGLPTRDHLTRISTAAAPKVFFPLKGDQEPFFANERDEQYKTATIRHRKQVRLTVEKIVSSLPGLRLAGLTFSGDPVIGQHEASWFNGLKIRVIAEGEMASDLARLRSFLQQQTFLSIKNTIPIENIEVSIRVLE